MKNQINNTQSCIVYLSESSIIVIYIVYIVILVVGLCGNIMTCAALLMQKSMRRSIHIYVFNLAICDLLILTIYVPNDMMRMGNQALFLWGPLMCTAMSTVVPVAVNSTVFTLLAISVDRARGVLQPFKWRADQQRWFRIVLPVVWVVSLSLAIPVIMHSKLVNWNCGVVCADVWSNHTHHTNYWYAMFGLTFSIPLGFILVLHALMFYKINFDLVQSGDANRNDDRRTSKMIVVIVIIFIVCTGSQHFYFLILTHTDIEKNHPKWDAFLFFGSNMLVTIQSACNPIIYGKFREDFNTAYRRSVRSLCKGFTTALNRRHDDENIA